MEWLIVLLLVAVLGVLIYLIWTRNAGPQDTQGMLLLQQRIQDLEKTLESKLGEGTTFTLTLPIYSENQALQYVPPASQAS